MIEVLYGPTPNCWKVSIMLEECGLPYRVSPIHLNKDEQFEPSFLEVSPNNRIPAIIDHDPDGQTEPLSIFESGAILLYLAEKSGKFLPKDLTGRFKAIEWVFWQMAGLGPMLGQHGYFILRALEKHPYTIDRFRGEAKRLYGVLDRQLQKTGAYVAGKDYTIADMACFPWVMTHKAQKLTLDDYPATKDWFATLRARPLLQKGIAAGKELFKEQSDELTPEAIKKIYGVGKGLDDEAMKIVDK